MQILKGIALVAAGLFASSALALISPDYMAMVELSATIGADSCFQVGAPSNDGKQSSITITSCDTKKGAALAMLVKAEYIKLIVADSNGKPIAPANVTTVDEMVKEATLVFKDNPHFVKAYPYQPMNPQANQILIEFKPEVIQVAVDNISNPYGLSSFVAADLFATFLNRALGDIAVGTASSPH
jgi:hypothetical protein